MTFGEWMRWVRHHPDLYEMVERYPHALDPEVWRKARASVRRHLGVDVERGKPEDHLQYLWMLATPQASSDDRPS